MLSRRSFLKSASAATAATAAPAVWSYAATADKASERLTVGVIGVGTMGRGHLGGLLGNAGVEVVAVCDVVKERTDAALEMVSKRYADKVKSGAYKGCKSYADFRGVIADKSIDAVLIATPDHWHVIPCVLAARAGKHIYCEKPLTHDVAEGRWLVNEIAKAKVTFQTGSQQRSEFGGNFRKAVEFIWNGRIGTLKTIRIGVGGPAVPCDLPMEEVPPGTDWDSWVGPAQMRPYHSDLCPKGVHKHFPAWRKYREFGGGQIADMGAHHFDIAQWAMNMDKSGPVEILPPSDPTKTSGLKFVYASGVVMVHNEFEGDVKADCVFEGSEGTILVSRSGISSTPDTILKEPLGEDAKRVYPSNNHRQNWLDCIKSGKETICPAETGARTATICHLGNIGYRLSRKLKWNPVKEQFIGDDAANKELAHEPRTKWKI